MLFGKPYFAVSLDERGELKLLEIKENGISPGAVARLLGAGGALKSVAGAAAKAAGKVERATLAALTARGVLRAIPRIKTPACSRARASCSASSTRSGARPAPRRPSPGT